VPRARTVAAAALVAVVAATGGVVVALSRGGVDLPGNEYCEAVVGDDTARLDPEQARYASLIAVLGVRRGLPARAVTIALATAYQESKISNPKYGDRDSLGLFQQRPSQGWGTPAQVRDPVHATNAFYAALEEVDGYRDLPVEVAAQRVQRSADGSAYAQHESSARALASALTGYSSASFTCVVATPPGTDQNPLPNGLTPAADAVRREVAAAFGRLPSGGYAPGGVSSGHSAGSAHYDGRAIDYFFRPVDTVNTRRGWALAHFLVANAGRLGLATVIFDDRIWTAGRSSEGWRVYEPGTDAEDAGAQAVLRHLDHVHVDVA